MKKIVIAPDSFKGSLAAPRFCEIAEKAVKKVFPDCAVSACPIADGGEGSLDCFLYAVSGKKISRTVSGPYFEKIQAPYGMFENFSVVELAQAAGYGLSQIRNPEKSTTYGVGQLISCAAASGAKNIILALGGSCTNDGGCGMAAAAGAKFYNFSGREFIPVGGTLKDIKSMDLSALQKKLCGISFIAMCDVVNPLYGENGAAYIYAPQKGADTEAVKRLDAGLMHLSEIVYRHTGKRLENMEGAGAAGGSGYGFAAFFGAELKRGIDIVLDAVKFDGMLKGADLVITGEGSFDSQSLSGKAVSGIASRAKSANVPVTVFAGKADIEGEKLEGTGIKSVFCINEKGEKLSDSLKNAPENLYRTIIKAMESLKKDTCI